MPRIPITIGSTAVVASMFGALAVILDPGPIETSAAALIAVGLIIAALTGLAGLLLARGPWGRWTLVGTVIVAMAVASVEDTPLTWITLGVGAVALVGCFGPWLRLWVRHHRVLDAPGPVVVFLLAAGPAAPLLIGLASVRSGATAWSWILAGALLVASALYGRGVRAGIWLMRVVVPVMGVALAVTSRTPGGLAVCVGSIAVAAAAWLPAALRTTTVVAPVLPQPIQRPLRGDR